MSDVRKQPILKGVRCSLLVVGKQPLLKSVGSPKLVVGSQQPVLRIMFLK